MNFPRIKKLQIDYNFNGLQNRINNGIVWKFEGSEGRHAMDALKSGICMLPKETTYDYYGNKLPSRDEVKSGSTGSYQNSVNFWSLVDSGKIDLFDIIE